MTQYTIMFKLFIGGQMADVELLQLAKKRLQEGESSFIIAEELKLPILIVEDIKRSLISSC